LSTLFYCGRCRITTPHEVMGDGFTCRRCGIVKSPTKSKSTRHHAAAHTDEASSSPLSVNDACSMPAARAHDLIFN